MGVKKGTFILKIYQMPFVIESDMRWKRYSNSHSERNFQHLFLKPSGDAEQSNKLSW